LWIFDVRLLRVDRSDDSVEGRLRKIVQDCMRLVRSESTELVEIYQTLNSSTFSTMLQYFLGLYLQSVCSIEQTHYPIMID
jgi:hypothetical protein